MQLNQLWKKASTGFEPSIPTLRSFKSACNQYKVKLLKTLFCTVRAKRNKHTQQEITHWLVILVLFPSSFTNRSNVWQNRSCRIEVSSDNSCFHYQAHPRQTIFNQTTERPLQGYITVLRSFYPKYFFLTIAKCWHKNRLLSFLRPSISEKKWLQLQV